MADDLEKALEAEAMESGDAEAKASRSGAPGASYSGPSAGVGAATTGLLGSERWVQFGFIAIGITIIFLLTNTLAGIVDLVSTKFDLAAVNPNFITAAGVILGFVATVYLYRKDSVRGFAREVATELSKVKWPDREETWSNTVVVIITSIVASIILFIFDSTWSWVTDLIYNV
jgi:preprotein translocase subunit SecE